MDNQIKEREIRTVWIIGILLFVSVAFSTVLHNLFPSVLKVPPSTGVPYMGYGTMFLMDLIAVFLAGMCFYHAWKKLGIYSAMIFLAGSFCFTGLEENIWVLFGRNIQIASSISSQLGDTPGTYYFTRGFFWFGEVPASICLGWFFIAYACVDISNRILPKAKIAVRALLGGFLAMNFDLWLDPVQVHPAWQSWKWLTNEAIKIFSIPLSNFAGWFLLIFLFALVFDRLPSWEEKHGPGKASGRLFLTLLALEACILVSIAIYGTLAARYIVPPVNLTIWGL